MKKQISISGKKSDLALFIATLIAVAGDMGINVTITEKK